MTWPPRLASRPDQVDLGAMQQTSEGFREAPAPTVRVGAFTIRPFSTTDDYKGCVGLQEATWGAGFSERVGASILRVSQRTGGLAAGAYDAEGGLAGFVFGMTGIEAGRIVHWSDMLAVRTEARNSGLGVQLKLYQRDVMLARGIDTILWTFDPLEAKNAYLNVVKLGATSREYVEDMYGQTDSPLHRGIGSDRLIARWIVSEGKPVGGGEDAADASRVLAALPGVEGVMPGELDLSIDAAKILVAVPSDIQALKAVNPAGAAAWRAETRAAMTRYLARGYEVRGFVRGDDTSDYVLSRASMDGADT